nr:hypothetical protein [Nitrosomonas nitrosa]
MKTEKELAVDGQQAAEEALEQAIGSLAKLLDEAEGDPVAHDVLIRLGFIDPPAR